MKVVAVAGLCELLFAAPATIFATMRGIVVSFSAEPRAHGAMTSHGVSKILSRGTTAAPNSRVARSALSGSTSATESFAPAAWSSLQR